MDFAFLFRRVTALFLCLLLVTASALPSAQATGAEGLATLTVAGGGISAGGLTGSAAVSAVAPYVLPVVCIALAGVNINAYLTEQSKEAGMTRSQYVKQTIDDYCDAAGRAKDKFYTTIGSGISVAANGTIQLSHAASKAISQFIEWMFTEDGLVVDTPAIGGEAGTGSIGSYTSFQLSSGNNMLYNVSDNYNRTYNQYITLSSSAAAVYCCAQIYESTFGVTCVSTHPFTVSLTDSYWNGVTSIHTGFFSDLNLYYANQTYVSPSSSALAFTAAVPIIYQQVSAYTLALAFSQFGYQDAVSVPGQDCFQGDAADYAENKDVFNPADNQATTLNPDVIQSILDSLGVVTDYTMSIADYLDAITAAYDQALEDVKTGLATLTDAVTGIKEQIAIPGDAAADPSISTSTAEDYPSLLNPDEIDVDGVIDGLSVDLTNIFPFCLPFDIYRICQLFSAEPTAPNYHVHYVGPYNIVLDFTVDLSPYDGVAAVARTLETLLFCIGLAYITRSMIIRG